MSKARKVSWIPLLCIIVIAACIRVYRLTDIPPGVNRDEASIGYTAYSLIKTGKDEYGRAFPLSFESFGDWKLPMYIYLTVPFVKVLGLNELAVRLPSAITGILAVIFTYFLIRSLFSETLTSDLIPLVVALFLAISPWSVHLSRVESESNLAVLLVTVSVLLWLKALYGKPKYFLFSYPILALTFWVYAGNHVFSSLLFLGLIVLSWKEMRRSKFAYVGVAIFAILLTVILTQTLFSADRTKISGISIFGDPTVVHLAIETPRTEQPNPNSILVRLLYNRATFAAETVFQNYLKAFSPQFLFISGGTNHAHNIENFGNLYLIEAPLFYLGIIYLLTKKKNRADKLLLWWLLISPIASSITKDAPHTNRIFAIYPLPPIVSTLGLVWLTERIKNKRAVIISMVVIGLLYTANVALYVNRYFVLFPRNEADNWGYGYKKLTQVLESPEYKDKHVIMSAPEVSPYIYLLFYSAYDPHTYQIQAKRYPITSDGFTNVAGYGRLTFRDVNWKKDICIPSTVLVDFVNGRSPFVYPQSKVIRLPNGVPFFQIFTTSVFGCIKQPGDEQLYHSAKN